MIDIQNENIKKITYLVGVKRGAIIAIKTISPLPIIVSMILTFSPDLIENHSQTNSSNTNTIMQFTMVFKMLSNKPEQRIAWHAVKIAHTTNSWIFMENVRKSWYAITEIKIITTTPVMVAAILIFDYFDYFFVLVYFPNIVLAISVKIDNRCCSAFKFG